VHSIGVLKANMYRLGNYECVGSFTIISVS